VGAVIGAGIFVLSGLGAHYAGPGLMLSFVVSGLGCAFAALCYAEFAAMIPWLAALHYAYATLGELFAWIIGWTLLWNTHGRQHRVVGWSNHFIELLDISISRCRCGCLRHWTGLRAAENIVRPADGAGFGTLLFFRHSGLPQQKFRNHSGAVPQLVEGAHKLLDAPKMFGVELGAGTCRLS